MIALQYDLNLTDLAKASVFFLDKRPLLKALNLIMATACWLILIGFILLLLSGGITSMNIASALFAIVWLCARKRFYLWLVTLRLRQRDLERYRATVHVHSHKLWWRTDPGGLPQEQRWKNMKIVYDKPDGFIIPVVGISKGGQFVWIPHAAFENPSDLSEFKQIIETHAIRLVS